MHYEIITNPASGSGKGHQVSQLIQQRLITMKISFHLNVSQHAGQPREIASHIAHHPLADTRLVVIGGDGTLHEVIDGLLQANQRSPIPVAYIPAGTGNDFARGYGISRKPLVALQQILDADNVRFINVGKFTMNQHQSGIFLNNFGTGFDAAIVHRTNTSRIKNFLNHHHLGTLSYVAKAIGALIHQQPFTVEVVQSNQSIVFNHAFLVVSSNHPYIGGGIQVAPDEDIERHELELVVLEKHDPITLLGSIIMFACGQVAKSRHAYVFRGRELQYFVHPAQYGQIDGEELGQHSFNLKMTCQTYPLWEQPLNK